MRPLRRHLRLDVVESSAILAALGGVGLVVGLYLPLVKLPESYSGPTELHLYDAEKYALSYSDQTFLLGAVVVLALLVGWRREVSALTAAVTGFVVYERLHQALAIMTTELYVMDSRAVSPYVPAIGAYVLILSGVLVVAASVARLITPASDHWVAARFPVGRLAGR